MNKRNRGGGRVQGGWAKLNLKEEKKEMFSNSPNPLWMVNNVDGIKYNNNISNGSKLKTETKFNFEKPANHYTKNEVSVKTINTTGVYRISDGPTGFSRLRFFHNFITKDESITLMEILKLELPWKQRHDVKNNTSYLQPRLTAWYGDLPYSYSGVTLLPNKQWNEHVWKLKKVVEEYSGLKFNSVLCNLYRDGHDLVSWHSDDEPSLGPQPTIASLSFGDTRIFQLRKKPVDSEEYLEFYKIPLSSGSLMIMEGCVQEDWQHSIQREYHDRDARINLTFRTILDK